MRVRVHFDEVNEVVSAPDVEHFLSLARQKAASHAPLLLRGLIKTMSDLRFAAEIVRQANAHTGRHDPAPRSAQEFLDWAVQQKYATIEAP